MKINHSNKNYEATTNKIQHTHQETSTYPINIPGQIYYEILEKAAEMNKNYEESELWWRGMYRGEAVRNLSVL